MKTLKLATLAIGATIFISACTKPDDVKPVGPAPTGTVEVYVTPMVGSNPFVINQEFLTPAGEQLTISDFRFFISQIGLARLSSQEVPAQPFPGDSSQAGIYLVDFRRANHHAPGMDHVHNTCALRFKADTGSYADLRFEVSVPRAYNQAEISTNPFPVNANTGMYWTWNSGFKFLVINGRTPLSTTPVHLSIGQNSRAMTYSFRSMTLAASRPRIVVREGQVTKIYLTYDLNTLLTNTDGSNYSFVQQPGRPTPLQVHGGYWSDILNANAANAMQLSQFETIAN